MLVLSRKPSEAIRIGDDILITVVRVVGNRVSIGVTAPPDMIVLRTELQERIEAERRPYTAPEPGLTPPDFDNVGL